MAAHALHADDATGRGATPTVAHLELLARCSERTVQRARAAARELEIGIEVFRGRHMTLDERMDAYEAGSKSRGWASVYALGCPPWLARELAGGRPRPTRPTTPAPARPPRANPQRVNPQPRRPAVDRGTPPIGRSTKRYPSQFAKHSSARNAEQRAARAASTAGAARQRGRPRWNQAGWDLAVALQRRIRTLAGVHPGRLAPAVTRFAVAARPWTAEELQLCLDRVLKTHGWTWLSRPEHPAGYLARLLREIDDTDQPTAAASAAADRARAVRAAEAAERAGEDLCAHGVAGADARGHASRCAFCRRERAGDRAD